MNATEVNKALKEILRKREELGKLDYNNPKYDDLEEQLHDLEDDFQESFGDELEGVFQKIHDEICPDNDVLLPIAYLKGVPVETEKYADKDTRLVLATDPTRIILAVGKGGEEVLWAAK